MTSSRKYIEEARHYTYHTVEDNQQDGHYIATVEEWPDIAGHGPTRKIALEDAQEAVALALKDRKEVSQASEPVAN